MALSSSRVVQRLPSTVLRANPESRPGTIGLITLDAKQPGKPSDRNGHARFDVAGSGNRFTVRLVSPLPEETGSPGRLNLRDTAPGLDPTFKGGDGNVGIMRSPVRATALPDFTTVAPT